MKSSTKKKVRSWLWPVVMTIYGIAEMVRATGDVTSLSWLELLEKSGKAAPFVIMGLVARKLFLTDPNDGQEDKKKVD